jgi:hypothetical protein
LVLFSVRDPVSPSTLSRVFWNSPIALLKSFRSCSNSGMKGMVDRDADVAFRKSLKTCCDRFHGRHTTRDVDGKLHHLEDPPLVVEDRIVRGLDIDLSAIFSDAGEFARLELAGAQGVPEGLIVRRADIVRFAEDRMVLSDDLLQFVADCRQEVMVGRQDLPVRGKLDRRLRAGNCSELATVFQLGPLPLGDIGRKLDDLVRFAAAHDRVIGGLQPDLVPTLAEALELGAEELAS